MSPLISIVIPSYKRPEYLKAALLSVDDARQAARIGSKKLEIIVIDDGHDASTHKICEVLGAKWSIKVRYQRSLKGPCAGPAFCRNQGIHSALGKLIYLLDDDDVYLPNRFKKSINLFTKSAFEVVLEPSRRSYVNDQNKPSYVTGPYGHNSDAFRFLMTGGEKSHITPGATAFRKEIFIRAGSYDETLRFGEDGELLLRLCLFGCVALVGGDPVVNCSIHDDNSSRPDRLHLWQNVKSLARLYQKMRVGPWPEQTNLVKHALSGKLDFALTQCRRTAPSYPARIAAGVKTLTAFDWRCASMNNFKSIAVWLTRGS